MKPFKILVFALFLLLSGKVLSQPFTWALTPGDSGAKRGNAVAIDEQKNLYVTGNLNGHASFGTKSITGVGSFLAKYNNSGYAVWAIALNGLTCRGVSVDIFGHTYITGFFTGNVQIGKFSFTSNGGLDFFLVRFDSSGKMLWARQGGGPGNDIAYAVATDLNGFTTVVGSFEQTMILDAQTSLLSLGKGDAFIAQYDSIGYVEWANKEGGDSDDAGTALTIDLAGNAYMTGRYSGDVNFYNQSVTSHGGYDVFIAEYDNFGLPQAVQVAGGAGDDIPTAIGLDGSADVYITGTFSGAADFGGKIVTSHKKDAFLASYNNNMQLQWAAAIGGPNDDAGTGISVDGHSNVFVTGVFSGKADFGAVSIQSAGPADIFIAKYDAEGRPLWARNVGGTMADSASAICTDHFDTAYIIGNIQGQSNFGNITLAANGNSSFFIAKMGLDPSLGIKNDLSLNQEINTFPNPSYGIFYIDYRDFSDNKINQWAISDFAGNLIKIGQPNNTGSVEIDLTDQPKGVYFLKVLSDKGNFIGKLVRM